MTPAVGGGGDTSSGGGVTPAVGGGGVTPADLREGNVLRESGFKNSNNIFVYVYNLRKLMFPSLLFTIQARVLFTHAVDFVEAIMCCGSIV